MYSYFLWLSRIFLLDRQLVGVCGKLSLLSALGMLAGALGAKAQGSA